MRFADQPDRRRGRHPARADRLALCPAYAQCTASGSTCIRSSQRRRMHDTRLLDTILDQRDVDGEFVIPLDEFIGAVEGIDQTISRLPRTGWVREDHTGVGL